MKISILCHGTRDPALVNSVKAAQAIGAKLEKLGKLLQNTNAVEIAPLDYFLGRADINTSVFSAWATGDNDNAFAVALFFDRETETDDFGAGTAVTP